MTRRRWDLVMLEHLVRMAVQFALLPVGASNPALACQGVSSNDAEASIFAVYKCSVAADRATVASSSGSRI